MDICLWAFSQIARNKDWRPNSILGLVNSFVIDHRPLFDKLHIHILTVKLTCSIIEYLEYKYAELRESDYWQISCSNARPINYATFCISILKMSGLGKDSITKGLRLYRQILKIYFEIFKVKYKYFLRFILKINMIELWEK